MSYIRGKYYTFGIDDDTLQFMCDDLYGTLPYKIFDELVVMRYAEMKEEGVDIDKFEKDTAKKYSGNFGARPLAKKHGMNTKIDHLFVSDRTREVVK